MKFKRVIGKTLRPIGALLLIALLTLTAILMILYSQWGQNAVRDKVLSMLNLQEGTVARLDSLRLGFPLRLDIDGLLMVHDGDTLVSAGSARVHVALLPLLKGTVDIQALQLKDATYVLGGPDSTMYMTLRAGFADLNPASVRLADMDIDVEEGTLRQVSVDMRLKQDTTVSPPSDPTRMAIHLHRLHLQDLTYNMRMLPAIDRLTAVIGEGELYAADIDLYKQTISIDSLTGRRLNATYLVPDSATIAANPELPMPADTIPSEPWTIDIGRIHFTDSEALYATQGLEPVPGLDFGYIQASDVDLEIDNFHNRATDIIVPLSLHATERCGLTLGIDGTFAMDSAGMYFRHFTLVTEETRLMADGMMGTGDMTTDPSVALRLKALGYASFVDLGTMFPDYRMYLKGFGANPLQLNVDVDGTAGRLLVNEFSAAVNGGVRLKASGSVSDMFGKYPGVDLRLSGNVYDVKNVLAMFMEPGSTLRVPPMAIDGHVRMVRDDIDGKLVATTKEGRVSLDASLKGAGDVYHVAVDADRFPVSSFMPDLGVGAATFTLRADGKGFDLMKPSADLDAALDVRSIVYDGFDYRNLRLDAKVHDGRGDVTGTLRSEAGDIDIKAEGNLTGAAYVWTATVEGRQLDLHAMRFTPEPAVVSVIANANATYTPSLKEIKATLSVPSVNYADEIAKYQLSGITADFLSNDTVTNVSVRNRDLRFTADAPCSLDTIGIRFADAMDIIDRQIKERKVDVDSLQRALPPFDIHMSAGTDNFISDILKESKMGFQSFDFEARNARDLGAVSSIREFYTGTTRLDSIDLTLKQDSNRMQIEMLVNNRPGTLDEWAHIALSGIFDTNRLALRATQRNIQDETGYDLGIMAIVSDSTISGRFFPMTPVIGYRKWTLNLDNRLIYNYYTHKIDVKIDIHDTRSSFLLTSNPAAADSINDINLKIKDIKLSEILAVNPFAPQIAGDLSADLNVQWDGGTTINGNGTVSLENFYYDKQRVASFAMDVDVATSIEGEIRAKAALGIDGEKVMTLAGALNDSTATSPLSLDMQVIKFPLAIANPFLSAEIAQLGGTLNGTLDVSGDFNSPRLDGDIYFDGAYAKMAMTNTRYGISDVHVPVEENVVKFKDFNISGANANPLYINGEVNLKSLTSPRFDLALKASNMLAVNSSKPGKNADIYGKLYLDLDATVRGSLSYMAINADVDVLAGTNVSYILSMAPSEYTSTSMTDMVRFVNLQDTTSVEVADSLAQTDMLMNINARLNIQSGTTFVVDLSSNARDKVLVQPQGSLNYTQQPMSDGRLIGRINIDGGYAHYTVPVIGAEKDFTFNNDSYVAFTGDILNPQLNIHATDKIKANVTQQGQNSRLIYFDVALNVTGNLESMNVAFDLSTTDDMTVANELQSMTAEQRANQAMNLLLYNMYTGPGTSATANLASNPLYSFLESQLNNWAANNIKGVDLSFGIDHYNQTTNGATSSTMNYSYRVSKTLFNDRFKIVVGGNYSTDDNADENISENLINDISFEYFLNARQTMLLRLFRHTGYESILEGEVTQTGVGFVYRKKLSTLVDMLPKFMRPRRKKY